MSFSSRPGRICGLALVFLLPLAACANLEGDWDGEIDCGVEFGNVDIEFELEAAGGGEFEGEGEITRLLVDGEDAKLVFEMKIERSKLWGVQEVDVDVDDCLVVIVGLGSEAIACEDPRNAEWDGADEIEAEVVDFLGTGVDCDLTVNR